MLAKKNKIEKNVILLQQFVELEAHKEFIGAADLYVTLLNEAQITSGTLAYTFGRQAVVPRLTEPAELLADDRECSCLFHSPASQRSGCAPQGTIPRESIRKNAYRMGRDIFGQCGAGSILHS